MESEEIPQQKTHTTHSPKQRTRTDAIAVIRHSWAWVLYLVITIESTLITIKTDYGVKGWAITAAVGTYTAYLFRGGRTVFLHPLMFLAPLILIPLIVMPSEKASGSAASLGSMTCKEFLSQSSSDRAQIADKLFTAKYKEVNSMGATNTLMNLEYSCEGASSAKLSSLGI